MPIYVGIDLGSILASAKFTHCIILLIRLLSAKFRIVMVILCLLNVWATLNHLLLCLCITSLSAPGKLRIQYSEQNVGFTKCCQTQLIQGNFPTCTYTPITFTSPFRIANILIRQCPAVCKLCTSYVLLQLADGIVPIDPDVLVDLERRAQLIAENLNQVMGGLRNSLHAVSEPAYADNAL